MKKFLFLFGLLAATLMASASQVNMVEYQSDVGTTYVVSSTNYSDLSATVINSEELMPGTDYQFASYDVALAGLEVNTDTEPWEFYSNDYVQYQLVTTAVEDFHSNSPPDAAQGINYIDTYRSTSF